MQSCEFLVYITSIACTIAECSSNDELAKLAAAFTQLGGSLSTILAYRVVSDNNTTSKSDSNTKTNNASTNSKSESYTNNCSSTTSSDPIFDSNKSSSGCKVPINSFQNTNFGSRNLIPHIINNSKTKKQEPD